MFEKIIRSSFVLISIAVLAAVPAAAQTPPGEGIASSTPVPGVRIVITELKRKGDALYLKYSVKNENANQLSGFQDSELIDIPGRKKYQRMSTGNNQVGNCAPYYAQRGETSSCWTYFTAPPAEVKKISVQIGDYAPIDDVPISE